MTKKTSAMSTLFKPLLIASAALGVCPLGLGLTISESARAAESQAGELTEIVVTARRVEERLQDVPISITVYDQRQLTDMNVTSATDLATLTPSLTVDSAFGDQNASFALRGFEQDIGTNPTVGVYFGDVVAPRGGVSNSQTEGGSGAGPGNFFDLENVQVLKGPQGTLFGRNTTGGDILLVPQKPNSEFGGYAEVSAGNYNMEGVQAVINVPISDRVRLRVGVDQQTRDGYMTNISPGVGPKDYDNSNYVAGRVSLVVDVTDDIENYTIGSFSQSDTNGTLMKMLACNTAAAPGSLAPFVGPMACAQIVRDQGKYTVEQSYPEAESYLRQWQIINSTTWDVNDDLTVKNIASYAQLQGFIRGSVFGDDFLLPSKLFGIVPLGSLTGREYHFTGIDTTAGGYGSLEQTVTEELQAHGMALGERLKWQVGAYLEDSFPLGIAGADSPTFITCTNFVARQGCVDPFSFFGLPISQLPGNTATSLGTITYRDYAFYGQATYTILDNLKFTAGVRETYDRVSSKISLLAQKYPVPFGPAVPGCKIPAFAGSLATNCLLALRTSSHAPTWEMDLDWKPVEDLLTYIKYSRGYRAGGLTPTGPIDPTIGTEFLSYKAEQVDTYEVGAKASFRGSMPATLDTALFYNDFSNQQLLTGFNSTVNTPTAAITNAGASKIAGIELSGTLKPIENVTLHADYTYLYTRIDSVSNPTLPVTSQYQSEPQAVPGVVLPYTPHNKVSFSANYQVPIDADLGKLSVEATYVYTGQQAVNPTVTYGYMAGYGLLNFNVDWESIAETPFDAEFFMTNALNKYYQTTVFDQFKVLGFAFAAYGPPRMFGGRVRMHF